MQKFYKPLLVFIMLGGIVTVGYTQGVTTAAINGKITDSTGEGLPGATIIAEHQPTGTQYGTSSRSDGRYNLPNMRIGGPYKLTVSFVGFAEQSQEGFQLLLGQNLKLDFELQEDIQTLGEIVISGNNETFNNDRTGQAISFSNEEIRKLPTITRSASDIYRLSPSSDGNSFAGRNDQFNNFSLDGSIFNNPFGLDAATPGGQTDAQPISLDAIDQIQVATAPYDVTQSGFTGASVNAVTKSGTNEFHGTVFSFYRTDELTGSQVEGEDVFVPDLTQLQSGFSIGGPIVKDKLFFFANMEIERRENLGSSFFANRGESGNNISRVTAADLDAVSAALQGIGYDPGPYEGYTHDTENEKGIVKLDWNISSKHTLTATYNFLNASRDLPANPTALGRRGPDAITLQFRNSGYRINNKINSGLLELRSIFNNKVSNKFQIGYSAFEDSRDPFSSPFPVLNINRDAVRYIVAGHEPFSINNRLDQYVFQITNNLEIYAGDHTLTGGFNFERFTFDNSFNLGVYEPFEAFGPIPGNTIPYAGGTFGPGFASVADFLDFVNTGQMANVAAFSQGVFDANQTNGTWALAESTVGQLGLYLQDRWQVNDNFVLTYGLRMDAPLFFDTEDKILENIERKGGVFSETGGNYNPDIVYFDPEGNAELLDQTELPTGTPLWSPRIGFNWDVMGDQTFQLRGGSGLFTGRLPFVWIGNQVANPDFFFRTTTDPDFRFPRVWRTSIGADKQIADGLIASLDLAYTKDVNAQFVGNYGLNLPTGNLNGVDNRSIYTAQDRSIDQFGGTANAYVFNNTDLGRSFNLTAEIKKTFNNGVYATLAYNFLDAKDASSLRAEITSDIFDLNPALGHANQPVLSNSIYGNRHRVVGTANKTFKYGNGKWSTTVSMYYEYARGGRFSYTYSGDLNNDGSFNNDLIYIPTYGEIENMTFAELDNDQDGNIDVTAAAQRSALRRFIAQDEYLSNNQGKYAERNAALSPWFSRWDLRLLQDYNFSNGNSIQFSLDILNVGNLISSDWGVRQFATNTQFLGVSVDGAGNPTYSFDPNLRETFTPDTGLISRYQLQFGLRYSF